MMQDGNPGTGRTRQKTPGTRGGRPTRGDVAKVHDKKIHVIRCWKGPRNHGILEPARLTIYPLVVEVPETYQSSTKRHSARGIAREGIARLDTWCMKED